MEKKSREEIRGSVVSLLADVFDQVSSAEYVKDTDSFKDDLGFESIDILDMVMHCETCFGVKFDMDEVRNLATVGEIVDYIYRLQR